MSREGSRVVFVGNIPYDGTEQQLSELFSEVGKVLSFRLVNDRETGKPKGFGFCEYGDAETAQSAIRNLNNVDFHGRNLRVDYADDDKATIGGQAAKARVQPKKRLGVDAISQVIDELSTEEQVEVLSQMKSFIESDPDSARQLLTHNQQLAQAMLRLLVLFDAVTPADIQGLTLPAASAVPPSSSVPSGPPPMQMSPGPMRRGPPPQMQGPGPDMRRPPPSDMRPRMPQGPPRRPGGPPMQRPMMHGAHGGHGPMPPLPRARGVPPGPGPPPHNDLPPEAQEMLQKVMAMSPDEIAALPPATQRQIQMLRQRVSGARGPPSGPRAPLPPHRRPLPRDGPPKRRHRGRDSF